MATKDHKRKARPIAPAVVTCNADSITVVIPDVLGKNESHQGGRYLSPATKNLRASVQSGVYVWRTRESARCEVTGGIAKIEHSQAMDGAWRAEILACWDRKRETIKGREIGFTCPMGDVDAPIAQVFDALQHAGILDDARVVEVRAWNMYRKGVRATVVRLVLVKDQVRCESGEQLWCYDQGQLMHHVPLGEPEPTKPRTKAARRKAKDLS